MGALEEGLPLLRPGLHRPGGSTAVLRLSLLLREVVPGRAAAPGAGSDLWRFRRFLGFSERSRLLLPPCQRRPPSHELAAAAPPSGAPLRLPARLAAVRGPWTRRRPCSRGSLR